MEEQTTQTAPAAGWHPDPDHPGLLRWWDGSQWTERRVTPVLVPEVKQLVPRIEKLAKDVNFIQTVVLVWVVLTVIGLLLLFLGL